MENRGPLNDIALRNLPVVWSDNQSLTLFFHTHSLFLPPSNFISHHHTPSFHNTTFPHFTTPHSLIPPRQPPLFTSSPTLLLVSENESEPFRRFPSAPPGRRFWIVLTRRTTFLNVNFLFMSWQSDLLLLLTGKLFTREVKCQKSETLCVGIVIIRRRECW